MSKNINYKQCLLKRKNETDIVFLPEKFAEIGKIIKTNKTGNGWVIIWVEGEKVDKEMIKIIQDQHKTTRKVSDI